jgi:hypothetical protein
MDRAYVEGPEVKGRRIERLRCYDSALGVRELEIVFSDDSMFVWRIVNNLRATGELLASTPEGLEVARRYPLI